MLLDRRMVDLTDSVEKAPLGNEMVAMAEGLEASNALGNCRVADKENLGFGSLLGKFVAFSSFLGLPMMEFEKEINPVLKKLETRRGLGVKIVGGKKKSPLDIRLERKIRKLECLVNYNCSPLLSKGKGRGSWDITQTREGSIMVTGQWFYRPEEAEKKGGGSWKSSDTRELFYSFHRDEVPAESVMHKCVVHFVPLNKQLPNRKQFPGFIVQRVYDTVERKLWRLTDKDYEDNLQHEVDLLVQKTRSRLGELFDIEIEEVVAEQEDQMKSKRTLRKKNMSPLDVTRDDEATTRFDQHLKPETPGSCTSNMSEYCTILVNFKALTGETHRDKWLEKLLQGIQSVCCSDDDVHRDDKEKGGSGDSDHASDNNRTETAHGSDAKSLTAGRSFIWPDAAVPAVTALEQASQDAFSSDFQKYNQKMRQLVFNLKNNPLLARRLLNGELEPSKILNMSPNELKEGLTAEETAKKEPEELKRMQMTDARCKRCQEKKVGVTDIIHAGNADRYQLECIACGNNWYAPRDEISTLNDGPSSARSVGTAPWATAKFEDVEKKLVSPRESEKLEALKKTTEPYMPVLDSQKLFSKPKNEDNPASAKTGDNSGSTKVTE
ncbi:hypothetical protein CK203_067714 [Vitis vinifera]|uniref:Uncharacterized protein n=1 Tax=Vitis vinifera TaxID=29760 RepID=A0A438BZC7_VITVI|nr:hypothetical protein CK203_067714 [Vitis vinifera]